MNHSLLQDAALEGFRATYILGIKIDTMDYPFAGDACQAAQQLYAEAIGWA